MEKMERSKVGQKEKLSSTAVLMEASVNLQGVLKLRWHCKVGNCDFIPLYQPVVSSPQPKHSL